jgi:serine protease Do
MSQKQKISPLVATIIVSALVSTAFGFVAGYLAGNGQVSSAVYAGLPLVIRQAVPAPAAPADPGLTLDQVRQVAQEAAAPTQSEGERLVEAVKTAGPAVVSIIGSKDVPVWERYYTNPFGNNDFFNQFFGDGFGVPQYRQQGTERQDVGAGTGFFVSADGYVVTNKHVVYDTDADYTVITGDGEKHDATVIGRDPVNDIAVLKVEPVDNQSWPFIQLGDSDQLDVGQTVLAIGYSLGEYENSVSKGIVSGLRRDITASGGGSVEQLYELIQTDAAINPGNSGGPLLDLNGRAIGVNVAMARGAENVGFAIAINDVKAVIDSVRKDGKISRPFLGIRYLAVTPQVQEKNQLPVDYGVLVVRGMPQDELAVMPGSPADLAGLEENDIILKIDDQKLDASLPLVKALARYRVGDEITLTVLKQGEETEIAVTLTERSAP